MSRKVLFRAACPAAWQGSALQCFVSVGGLPSDVMAAMILNQTSAPSWSPLRRIASTLSRAFASASSPCCWMKRCAVRLMSRSEIGIWRPYQSMRRSAIERPSRPESAGCTPHNLHKRTLDELA